MLVCVCDCVLYNIIMSYRSPREMELDNDFDKLTAFLKRLLIQIKVLTLHTCYTDQCAHAVHTVHVHCRKTRIHGHFLSR